MTTAYSNGYHTSSGDRFGKIFHLLINLHNCMAISFDLFFLAVGMVFNHKLQVAEIKMTE